MVPPKKLYGQIGGAETSCILWLHSAFTYTLYCICVIVLLYLHVSLILAKAFTLFVHILVVQTIFNIKNIFTVLAVEMYW